MIPIHQQLQFIEAELDKHRIAYDISVKKLNNGDKSASLVLPLLSGIIENLVSIKISLQTLKNIDQ